MPKSLPKCIAEVDQSLERGDLLLAFDQACAHLTSHPESEALKHKGLLALARAGATERASRLFAEWGLSRSDAGDVLALEARIAKDRALKLSGAERRRALLDAAGIYRRIHEKTGDSYPAINWASLCYLAGAKAEAAEIAATVLADRGVQAAADYWALATRAEASLIIGRLDSAAADLREAAKRADSGAGARSSTRRQFRLLLSESGLSPAEIDAVLAPLAPPPTIHYTAPGPADSWSDFSRASVAAAARRTIREALEELRPGAVFGSLGNPAEILLAEQALAAGIELNVVLPLPKPAFVEHFLAQAGERWAKRFGACCRRAHRVILPSDDAFAEDPSLADYGARVAMGLALLRAQHLDGEPVQLVLPQAGASFGSDATASTWTKSARRRQIVLPLREGAAQGFARTQAAPRPSHAVVFGDLPGFSRMPEKYLPIFWDTVMKVIGDVVQAGGDTVALKTTWGDAIHLVVSDVRSAADICLTVQRRLAKIDGRVLGRDEPPTMRIGAHYGPVFAGWDPVAAQKTYYGRALSQAARIEPITPPGTVYVTEAFAAILLLESDGEFTCTYVGQVPLAKGYGTFRMYDLVAEPSRIDG